MFQVVGCNDNDARRFAPVRKHYAKLPIYDYMTFKVIRGQGQGHMRFKVSKMTIFKFYLLRHFSTNEKKFQRFLTLDQNIQNLSGQIFEFPPSYPGPSRATAGPRESILTGPYHNLIPTETSCQLLTRKTHRRKVG